jgi:two-component system sensor histidine kinase KdpD
MGQSARSRIDEVVRGSIVNRIMRETRNIDIVVVADPERASRGDEGAGDG